MAASPLAGRGGRRRKRQHRRRRYRAKYTTLLTRAAWDKEHKARRRGTVSDNWRRVVRTFPEQTRHTKDKKEALSPLFRQPGIDLIYEPTTVFERGPSLDFLEHDCTSIQQGPAFYPVVKGNRDFLDAYLA